MPAVNLTRQTWLATNVRTAEGFLTRLVGLLGRRRLGAEEALWLVPCRGVHTFGMRFPIDLLFLDEVGDVVGKVEDLHPWRVSPVHRRAHSVLELRSGTIRKSGTREGDRVEVAPAKVATLDDLRSDSVS